MAIWQFSFHWVPRDAVKRLHGSDAIRLDAYGPFDLENWDEDKDSPNYWNDRSPLTYAASIEALLPRRKSWSEDALMFGDEEGDDVSLWEDDVNIRLDIRKFNEPLARALVGLASRDDLRLAISATGRLIPPIYEKLTREISKSRAFKFASDPTGTLRMIGREHDQREICKKYAAEYCASPPTSKLGISKTILKGLKPINGLRHPPANGTNGWYIWAGDEFSTDPDFFDSLHVAHIDEWESRIGNYLGLAPGWRFQIADGHEDVWFDEALLGT